MKYFIEKLFFIFFCLSVPYLSAVNVNVGCQSKLYFAQNELEIEGSSMRIHFDDHVAETNVLRSDQAGLYILENDITSCYSVAEKQWKCPYCYHWWPIGQKCENENCPTNKWGTN